MATTNTLQEKVDIALIKGDDGIYDYEIDDIDKGGNGDFVGDAGYDSSIIQDVFAELQASEDEEIKPLKRRGSIVNENPIVAFWQVGSKVWFYDQARATIKTKNGAADTIRESLQKYVPQYLQDVKVVGTLMQSGVRLNITLVRKSGKIEKLYYDLWDKTGS